MHAPRPIRSNGAPPADLEFMSDDLPTYRKLMLALGADRPRVERAFHAARAQAYALRQQIHELEITAARAWEILELTGTRIPWPPQHGPVRPPTLHQAMVVILEERNNLPMRPRDLALHIAKRGLYRRRDGLPASANDVSARVSAYAGLFKREGYVVLLRRPQSRQDAPPPSSGDPADDRVDPLPLLSR